MGDAPPTPFPYSGAMSALVLTSLTLCPPPTKIASKPMLSSSHSTKILYKYCWKNTYIVFYMRKIIKSY